MARCAGLVFVAIHILSMRLSESSDRSHACMALIVTKCIEHALHALTGVLMICLSIVRIYIAGLII